jgi:hypothetical protein
VILITVQTAFLAHANVEAQTSFSYEDCMTSGESRDKQRSICNTELRQFILSLASYIATQFENKETQACSSKEKIFDTLDLYYQYVALMQIGSIDSAGLSATQIEESMSRIKDAHYQIFHLCD